MQAKKRYILVFISCAFLAYCYFGGYRLKDSNKHVNGVHSAQNIVVVNKENKNKGSRTRLNKIKSCRMETCFDYTKCLDQFLIYIYPPEPINSFGLPPVSQNYQKILTAIRESRYYTSNPEKACLFVLGIDTLDRDNLSEDYVRNVPSRLARLPYWNNGRNHIIFNLYSGTWPDYTEHSLGFDPGEAILAKASMSVQHMREGFDISIPLFHKQFPLRAGNTGFVQTNNFPTAKKYLLAFKGKRYVHGIGSETRNSLFHLHNGKDLVLVTTCRHGKSWRELQDSRCDEDNREYDRYDYETLLQNSTFCLVPRGRRLGSFRFLEALQAGCIPVLLSNAWVLPFESKIDWKQAAIWADERLLLQVPEIVRSISTNRILALRQQTQILWERYFGSIEKIVFTTLEIIRERLPDYPVRNSLIWNTSPGALLTLPTFSDSVKLMPFLLDNMGAKPRHNFTAVIYVQIGGPISPNSALYKLVKGITKSQFVDRILILWASDRSIPSKKRWPSMGHIPFNVIPSRPSMSQRFFPYQEIKTDAVISLDEDAILNTDEIDFAYTVWRDFPERIVGYPARAHFWDDSKNAWGYTSKWTNYYSIVLTGAAFYHRYYNYLYTNWLSLLVLKTVQQSSNCEDILMNLLVSHVTRKPPIKVTQRKGYKDREGGRSPWNDPDHFIQRQGCLNTFAAVFGYMPLLRSNLRLDPVLYRDPVSNLRKKYRQIELVGS
ncbi:exostosin-1 isoform X2 [Condylostylus longicornis]|uniref:exostosin-1 isoform X2 n=1 Tax=Condylostylus longicornis TaxID=2530218 RepID=UPI00244D9F06|nr:exostosin-1 isoform X2 [Condylostylus longicornis]